MSCNETIPAKVVGGASGLAFDPKFFGISRRGDAAVRSEYNDPIPMLLPPLSRYECALDPSIWRYLELIVKYISIS